MKTLIVGVYCLLFVGNAVAADPPKPALPTTKVPSATVDSLEAHRDLVYSSPGGRELRLDLYRPKKRDAALPVVLLIHGGGWFKGERGTMTNLAQAVAARGYVTANVEYRLADEAKFPAGVHDCKAAVRWLRANADRYGIDTRQVGVTGLSAGGHIAALLATSGGVKELDGSGGNADDRGDVQACVAMGAPTDLKTEAFDNRSEDADSNSRRWFGGTQREMPKVYALASPRHHVDANDPPILFMSGGDDSPNTHAVEMRADLQKLGIDTGLVLIPNAPHAFLGKQKHFDAAVDACDEFFGEHLK